jgi:hypothetical protein
VTDQEKFWKDVSNFKISGPNEPKEKESLEQNEKMPMHTTFLKVLEHIM